MARVLFLGEGSSDEGIADHIERIAYECDVEIAMTVPKMELIPSDDKSVRARLDAIRRLDGEYDLAIIHRDGDRDGREARLDEIRRAVESVMPASAFAAVIPIRMTEAWLVLDEMALRTVAGNPNGKVPLPIPGPAEAERIADPKALLRDILVAAAELTGRKRRIFQTHFPSHRRLLLQRLRADGRSVSSGRGKILTETYAKRLSGCAKGDKCRFLPERTLWAIGSTARRHAGRSSRPPAR